MRKLYVALLLVVVSLGGPALTTASALHVSPMQTLRPVVIAAEDVAEGIFGCGMYGQAVCKG